MSVPQKISRLIIELSRRRVIRALGVYVVTLWLLTQGVADIFPAFGMPDWSVRAFVALGLLMLPVVVAIAWRYDLTPEGLVPDGGAPDATGDDDELTLTDFGFSGVVNVAWNDLEGDTRQRAFDAEFSVGRDADNAIALVDKRVSRRHVRFFPKGGNWWIEDLESSNGTYLNGERVQLERLAEVNEVRLHRRGPRLKVSVSPADDSQTGLQSTPQPRPPSGGPSSGAA